MTVMNTQNYTLSSTDIAPAQITAEFDSLLERLDQKHTGDIFHRSDTSNFMICVARTDLNSEREELISLICRLVAGRVFVVCIDDESSDLFGVNISAQCHQTSDGEFLCAELVEITAGRKALERVPSIVHAHALVGFPIDVLFLGDRIPSICFEHFLPFAEKVFFHGAQLAGRSTQQRHLLEHTDQLIDLLWVQLAGWRGELKEVFGSQRMVQLLTEVGKIEISFGSRGNYGELSSYYIAGWILDRLQLNVVAVGARGFECQMPCGSSVDLICEHRSDRTLDLVSFQFGVQGDEYVRISSGKYFETQVSLAGITRTTHNEQDALSVTHCLENYFLVGESVVNYRGAIERALELQSLRSGFQGIE